jgi:hypothetical protein
LDGSGISVSSVASVAAACGPGRSTSSIDGKEGRGDGGKAATIAFPSECERAIASGADHTLFYRPDRAMKAFAKRERAPTVAKADEWRLDRSWKTPSRFAFRALEDANFMTGFSRLDASQPHRLATPGTRKNSDLRAAVQWISLDG